MAGKQASNKLASNQKRDIKKDNGSDFGAAFGANLRRGFGEKRTKSNVIPVKQKPSGHQKAKLEIEYEGTTQLVGELRASASSREQVELIGSLSMPCWRSRQWSRDASNSKEWQMHTDKILNDTAALAPDPEKDAEFQPMKSNFVFSGGQLHKLVNTRSLTAFNTIGGFDSLERGLRTDRKLKQSFTGALPRRSSLSLCEQAIVCLQQKNGKRTEAQMARLKLVRILLLCLLFSSFKIRIARPPDYHLQSKQRYSEFNSYPWTRRLELSDYPPSEVLGGCIASLLFSLPSSSRPSRHINGRKPAKQLPWTRSKESKQRAIPNTQEDVVRPNRDDQGSDHERHDVDHLHRIFGRESLQNWKSGAGRSKAWRRAQYAKAPTKRQEAVPIVSQRKAKTYFQLVKVATSQITGSELSLGISALALRSRREIFKKYTEPMIGDTGTLILVKKRQDGGWLKRISQKATNIDLQIDGNCLARTPALPIEPQESAPLALKFQAEKSKPNVQISRMYYSGSNSSVRYLGRVISSQKIALQIIAHVRSEKQYQVYKVKDLMTGEDSEAFVYPTSNLSKTQRKARDESLKKQTAASSWEYTFDFDGLKYCIFSPTGPDTGNLPRNSKPGLGAIGRRNSPGYQAAFPILPGSKSVLLTRPVKRSQCWATKLFKKPQHATNSKPQIYVDRGTPVSFGQVAADPPAEVDKADGFSLQPVYTLRQTKFVLNAIVKGAMGVVETTLDPCDVASAHLFKILDPLVARNEGLMSQLETYRILREELENECPGSLPLATRILVRLNILRPSWMEEVAN